MLQSPKFVYKSVRYFGLLESFLNSTIPNILQIIHKHFIAIQLVPIGV